jgi:hypothetical protein
MPIIGSYFHMERTTGKGEPIVFYKEGGEPNGRPRASCAGGRVLRDYPDAVDRLFMAVYRQHPKLLN